MKAKSSFPLPRNWVPIPVLPEAVSAIETLIVSTDAAIPVWGTNWTIISPVAIDAVYVPRPAPPPVVSVSVANWPYSKRSTLVPSWRILSSSYSNLPLSPLIITRTFELLYVDAIPTIVVAVPVGTAVWVELILTKLPRVVDPIPVVLAKPIISKLAEVIL